MRDSYSADPKKRDLQFEAKAHTSVQAWIDGGAPAGKAFARQSIAEIHRRFYENSPEELCWVTDPESDERVRIILGRLRHRDVRVGDHIGVSPGAVPRFLDGVTGRLETRPS